MSEPVEPGSRPRNGVPASGNPYANAPGSGCVAPVMVDVHLPDFDDGEQL